MTVVYDVWQITDGAHNKRLTVLVSVRESRTNRYIGACNLMKSNTWKPDEEKEEEDPTSGRDTPTTPLLKAAESRIEVLEKENKELKVKAKLLDQISTKLQASQGKVPSSVSKIPRDEKNCDICDREFQTNALLKRHVQKVHEAAGRYPCTEDDCPKTFMSAKDCQAHIRNVHKGQGFQCEVEGCDVSCSTKRALVKHQKRHKKKPPVYCSFCKQEFDEKDYLKEHEPSCLQNPNRATFTCHQCEREFHQRKHLNKHLRDDH